jgi:hypothetical protein
MLAAAGAGGGAGHGADDAPFGVPGPRRRDRSAAGGRLPAVQARHLQAADSPGDRRHPSKLVPYAPTYHAQFMWRRQLDRRHDQEEFRIHGQGEEEEEEEEPMSSGCESLPD